MVNCKISYDNNHLGIFFSGQRLSSNIELTNEKKRKITGISLRIEGCAKCEWQQSEGTGKNSRTVLYRGQEDYINKFSYLIGSSNGEPIDWNEGVHKFNFICDLPSFSPTSLESQYGNIRYQIKVEVERPWKIAFKFCYLFTVVKPLDLNYENPSLKLPLKVETFKNFFLGLSHKNLSMSAEIPFCGYVSGQTALIDVSINNESRIEVYEVTIELIRKLYYHSDTPMKLTKIKKESVSIATHSGVPSKEKRKFRVEMGVQPAPPTNIGTCKTIELFYEILMTARTSGMHKNLTAVLPITIGTVPLASTLQTNHQQEHLGWNVQPSTSQAPYPLAPTVPLTDNLPPPAYHEAMMNPSFQNDKKESDNEQQAFNPKYSVFYFNDLKLKQPTDPKDESKL